MNIAYFSPIHWSFLKQRPQHLAEEFSKHDHVFFIEPSVSLLHSIRHRNNDCRPLEYQVSDTLKVVRPDGRYRLPKFFDLVDVTGLNLWHEQKSLQSIIQAADIIWISSPLYYGYILNSKKPIVYDKMDKYDQLTTNPFLKRLILKNESKLLQRANLVFASSKQLYDDLVVQTNNVKLIRNGLDSSLCWKRGSEKEPEVLNKLKNLKGYSNVTLFGYVGAVDHWFDYEAIQLILNYSPNFHVVIVGYNNLPRINHDNLHYIDSVPKQELAEIIPQFDVCLYPFRQTDWLDTIDPVKIYEYLSFNKPVISVRSMETVRFADYIQIYGTYNEFVEILDRIPVLSVPFLAEEQLHQFIDENSWTMRAEEVREHFQLLES
ncbi:hypothetical protein [Paenibacillus sp. 4624]|uniref:hypothetical protein n=1 Tax=Paenibacillus sp. 4624 TaxID=3156453 RepID=UPI003D1A9575